MVLLNVSFEEKEEAKKLGARWNRTVENPVTHKSGCWYVPDGKDVTPFQKWMVAKEVSYEDFMKEVGDSTVIPQKQYIFKGDVNKIYNSHNSMAPFYVFSLICNHNTLRTIQVKVESSLLGNHPIEAFIDKQVEVMGTPYVYADMLVFQVKAAAIKIVGPCTRLIELEDWKKKCNELLAAHGPYPTGQEQWPDGIHKVGVISNANSRGFMDFMECLNNKYVPNENIIVKDVTMKLEDIIKAIHELNEENECDVICIVRGGGDPEGLVQFSKPELLEAIIYSNIPVVPGIGHTDDVILCKKVAFYPARTPTDAANFINTQNNRKKKAERSKFFNTQMKQGEENLSNLKEKYEEASAKVEELQQEIERLNIKIAYLTQENQEKQAEPEKKSLLARIFRL